MKTRMKRRAASHLRRELFESSNVPGRPIADDDRHVALRTDARRLALIESVRLQIAAGTYDTPDRLDVALDRLLDTQARRLSLGGAWR